MKSLFSKGFRGLSDTKFAGVPGSVYRSVGVDHRSEPGLLKVHQKLTKHSSSTIDELCSHAINLSDGSRLWFSSESGKIWRETGGTYTLVYTTDVSAVSTENPTDHLDTLYEEADLDINLTDDTALSNDCQQVAQRFQFSTNTKIDKVTVWLKEVGGIDGSYDLTCSIVAVSSGLPSGSVLRTVTQTISAGDIGTEYAPYTFTLPTPFGASASVDYYVVIKVDDYADVDTGEAIAISAAVYDSTAVMQFHDGSSWSFGLETGFEGIDYHLRMVLQENYRDNAYDTYHESATTSLQLTDDTSLTNDCQRVAQSFSLTSEQAIDTVYLFLREVVVDGGYSVKVSIQAQSGSDPSGTDLVSVTDAIVAGDIGTDSAFHKFTFPTAFVPIKNVTYWLVVEITDYADIDATEALNVRVCANAGSGSVKVYNGSSWTTTIDSGGPTSNLDLLLLMGLEGALTKDYGGNACLGAGEYDNYVYWAVEKLLNRIRIDYVTTATDWTNQAKLGFGVFANGHDTYHPMTEVNNTLFIGDAQVMASVDNTGSFTAQTALNVEDPEVIRTITRFDIDVLIGTERTSDGRVLRWDGIAESWYAEDEMSVKGGVCAFLTDDNFTYVMDEEGHIWLYNGSKSELYTRIPEVGRDKIKVNHSSVGYYLGVPIFGLSNSSGNPVLQGVYGFGKYSRDYPAALTLDYPLPSGEFSGVEIGAIIIDGNDLYVAWKDGVDEGVAKLDTTAKYASAYMETRTLTGGKERTRLKTLKEVEIPYYSLPASTGVTVGLDPDYGGSFDSMTVQDDTRRKIIELETPNVPDVVNPRLRIGFTVNSNDAPEIEDVLYDLVV